MIQSFWEIILHLIQNIPSAIGEFAPLLFGGAILLFVSFFLSDIFRGGM